MSKYITKRLKADDEATMLSVLERVFGTEEDGNLITSRHGLSIVLLGTLYAETGNMLTDDEGNEYPERAALDGYHVNLRTKNQADVDALADYIVDVDNPLVKYAGEE